MSLFSKLNILTLPTQGGKTFTCIKKIEERIFFDDIMGKSIHIVMTQNTLMNQAQFLGRIQSNNVISFGSKSLTAIDHANNRFELIGKFKSNPNFSVIVCCLNDTRLKDFKEMFSQNQFFANSDISVYMYFDEVHETISMCKPFIEEFSRYSFIEKMTCITATPERIAREFHIEKICDFLQKLEPTQVINTNFYYKIREHDKCLNPSLENEAVVEYTMRIVKHYHPYFFRPYAKNFVPSSVSKKSHIEMKDKLLEFNSLALVIVINTNIKKLFFYNDQGIMQEIDLFKKPEKTNRKEKKQMKPKLNMSVIITDILIENHLQSRPLFITGHECISVGVTFCGPEFGSFTNSVIYFPNMLQDDLYQFAGRTTGNIKTMPNFEPTTIFTTFEIYQKIIEQENYSHQLFNSSLVLQSKDCLVETIQDTSTPILQTVLPMEENNIIHENETLAITPTLMNESQLLDEENTDVSKIGTCEKFRERYKSKKRIVIESDSEEDENPVMTSQQPKLRIVDYSDSEGDEEYIRIQKQNSENVNDIIDYFNDIEYNSLLIDLQETLDKSIEIDIESISDAETISDSETQENIVYEIDNIQYKIFYEEEDAIMFIKEKCRGQKFGKARKYPGTRCSPMPNRLGGNSVYQMDGLTCKQIASKKWGLDSKNKFRKMFSTVENKYVVYWKK